MIIKLPQPRKGAEILEAFLAAATFTESLDVDWRAERRTTLTQFDSASGDAAPYAESASAMPYKRGKRWLFWGAETWRPDASLTLMLKPLVRDRTYKAVEVAFEYEYDWDQEGNGYVTRDWESRQAAAVRDRLAAILNELGNQLKRQTA